MAYDVATKRVYVNRDITPHVGISIAEIRAALGENANVDLSRSGNIKKWAKFKPMPIGGISGYTDAQAKLINYGLHVPYYTSLHAMFQDILAGTWTRAVNYDANKPFWTYDGLGANDWARVLDFDGYLGTARELMEQITVANYCAIDDTPTFISHNESTTDGNLAPKDMRVIENGSISAQNMYYGIFLYNGLIGRQFRIVGETANLTTGNKQISDSRFVFPRLGDEQNIKACIFLSSYNIGNGAVVENEDNFSGYFIPITTSLATLFITFERMTANLSSNPDTVTPWEYELDGSINNVIFVFKALPNKTASWGGSLFGQSTNGVYTVVYTDPFTIDLPKVESGGTQYPCWIRLETDFAHSKATVKVYVTDNTVDFVNVFHEDSTIGSPWQTVSNIPITGDGDVNHLQWANIAIEATDGSSSTDSCDVGTPPSH